MAGNNDKLQHGMGRQKEVQEDQRKRRTHSKGSGSTADWSGVNGELLTKAVAAIAKYGGAVRLGYSRDGGAYAVGIYGDGDPFTEYIAPSDDLDGYLKGLIDDYGD